MARETFLPKGLVKILDTVKHKVWGEFNLNRWFKDTAKRYHIPYFDVCCEADIETEATYPVRYNYSLQRLEYFNGTVWADIISIDETTSTTTTSTTTTSSSTTTTTTV